MSIKKTIAVFVVGGALGFAGGAGAMLVAFPFLFPPPPANEKAADAGARELLLETRFREDADGQDPAHWGKGGLKVWRGDDDEVLLEFQDDFEVGAGPNFWLYLNGAADIDDEADFLADGARVKLAKVKSFSGSQVYAVDEDAFDKAKSATIWCETFGQYIASANLDDGG